MPSTTSTAPMIHRSELASAIADGLCCFFSSSQFRRCARRLMCLRSVSLNSLIVVLPSLWRCREAPPGDVPLRVVVVLRLGVHVDVLGSAIERCASDVLG